MLGMSNQLATSRTLSCKYCRLGKAKRRLACAIRCAYLYWNPCTSNNINFSLPYQDNGETASHYQFESCSNKVTEEETADFIQ